MKLLNKVLTAVLLLTAVSMFAEEASVPAAEAGYKFPKPSFNLNVQWGTGYFCDGFILNPDPVTSLDFSIGLGNFYAGVWGQYDWTGYNGKDAGFKSSRKNNFEELDYYAGYAYTIDDGAGFADLTIEGVFTYMDYSLHSGYPKWDPNHEKELSLILSLGNMLNAEDQSLTAAARFDYETVEGKFYGQIDGSYTKALCEKVELELDSSIFWGAPRRMRHDAGRDHGWGIRSIVFEAAVNYSLCKDLVVSPFLGASYLPNPAVRNYTRRSNDHVDSNTWAGIRANYAF